MLPKRITGPRKFVLPGDGAIDQDAMDKPGMVEKFRESQYDVGLLPLLDGERPTYFHCSPLTVRQKRAVQSLDVGTHTWCEMVVRMGLVRAENAPDDFPQPDREKRADFGICASVDWIDRVQEEHMTFADVDALATMIWVISEASPLSRRRSGTPPGPTGSPETQQES